MTRTSLRAWWSVLIGALLGPVGRPAVEADPLAGPIIPDDVEVLAWPTRQSPSDLAKAYAMAEQETANSEDTAVLYDPWVLPPMQGCQPPAWYVSTLDRLRVGDEAELPAGRSRMVAQIIPFIRPARPDRALVGVA